MYEVSCQNEYLGSYRDRLFPTCVVLCCDSALLVLVSEHVVHEDLEGLALADGVVQHDGLKNTVLQIICEYNEQNLATGLRCIQCHMVDKRLIPRSINLSQSSYV